jgi:two-component system, OmpR family, phosphate regulon sensor histidine kinase PhoR
LKNRKPIHLVLFGSIAVGLCAFTLLLLGFLFTDGISYIVLLLVPLFIFIATYFIFHYLIKVFLNDKLKLIYKSVRKGKATKETIQKLNLNEDVITSVEQEAELWSEERNTEISKLKDQEEFRREFLGNLAHELKTPVFSIQGYILTLLDGALEDETVNRTFLERASKATDRMANILEDLDQITRLEVDDLKLEMRPFDIVELTQEVFDSFEIIAKEKNIKLRFSKENIGSFIVNADKSKISQVLTNLIGNSIFYGNVGGETLARFYESDGIVTIEISDNGLGIEDKYIARLFERFYRVEKSRNRNEGGSGLGLAIVKHIIEAHGQTISVRSTVGLGSTFSFTLDESKLSVNALYSSRGIQIK